MELASSLVGTIRPYGHLVLVVLMVDEWPWVGIATQYTGIVGIRLTGSVLGV